MIVTRGENYPIKRFPRVKDSPYEFSPTPDLIFYGRPANNLEKKTYRLQQGVNANNYSVFVLCSNLPQDIKPQDKIEFMGKEWTIISIGYYFDSSRITNAKIFSNEYLEKRAPKGVVLE